MNTISTILMCTIFGWTLPSAEQVQDGWIALFDGATTFGWTSPDLAQWPIEGGVLTGSEGATLTSTTEFPAATVTFELKQAECEGWEKKTVELKNAAFELKVPAGQLWNIRNVFLKPEGMKSIYNGQNLDNWNVYPEMPGKFTVDGQNGELLAQDGPGMLESKESYADFVFQIAAFTAEKNLNSGVFFRCIPGEKMNGYESQIHNGTVDGDRTKPLDSGTGAIFRRTVARYVNSDDQTWLRKTIVAHGAHISVWVNGLQVTDWTDDRKPNDNPRRGLRLEAGTFMLQAHDPTTNVRFKDINVGTWE